jgi:hypothetical protein
MRHQNHAEPIMLTPSKPADKHDEIESLHARRGHQASEATQSPFSSRLLTTADAAKLLGIKPQTLRAALSRKGHYFGVRPQHLPNGRLFWPEDEMRGLFSQC